MSLTVKKWLRNLDKVPKEERRTWIKKSLKPKDRLHVFGKYFFRHIIKGSYEIPECHLALIQELTKRRNSAIIFPRGFAKTTWEKIDTLHDIVYGTEPVIVYCSDSLRSAGFHFESIKIELENNDLLIKTYGNLVPSFSVQSHKWTNQHFETTNGINVIARGAGKGRGINIKNQRPTKIILDDVETDEQVLSPERRRQLHDWIYNVVIPSLDKERGFAKMVGTVINPDAEILKFYKANGGIFRRAIENGKSIWENYWSFEDLMKLRDGYTNEDGEFISGIGTAAFSKEYMNEPIDDATAIFKREWLERNIWETLPPQHMMRIVIAVDPNAGEKQQADFMGITVMGLQKHDKKRYVLETRQEKVTIEKQLKIIEDLDKKWNPQAIGIEKIMNQTALYQLARAEKSMPIKALSPEGKDKVNRAYRIQPLVEQDVIKFNRYDTALYNELIQFPNGVHDDVADSFFYANEMLQTTSTAKLTSDKTGSVMGDVRRKKF